MRDDQADDWVNKYGFNPKKDYFCRICGVKFPCHLMTTSVYKDDLSHKSCLKRGEVRRMRKVNLSCSCGAVIVLEDTSYTLIEKGGKLDNKGRKYLIDKQADEWQERHQECTEVSKLQKENEKLSQQVCDECSSDDIGWVYNREEGRVPCTCMLEAGPYQELQKQIEELQK